jgi:dephospho-CoA kinase
MTSSDRSRAGASNRAPEDHEGSRRSVRIGITGPIGCGKSTVARWLGELGAAVIDADSVARDVTAPGEPALDAVIARFGERYRQPDGTLDRAALGRLVFTDAEALRDLEAIVHPAVRPRILASIEEAEAGGTGIVAIEAIKLVEGGLASDCDEVWLVVCSGAEQRARLTARGSSPIEADERIEAQGDLAARLAPFATLVVDASGSREAVRGRVQELARDAVERHLTA